MGKNRRHVPKKNFAEKRREKQNKKNEWSKMPHQSYAEIIKQNKDFEAYYKNQRIVPDDEWELFINTMKNDLPTAFRITGSKSETKTLLKIIKGDFFKEIMDIKIDESENCQLRVKPQCLPFYPEELGWQLQISRKNIRRSESFLKLHNFLIAETNSGNISRQEVVSMIPPLVLDVKSGHKVLDMCAAPGSKTAQLIEMIHAEDNKKSMPEGFVVANDIDNNRCYMLVHQAKRLNSPNIMITNYDSSVLPNFTVTNSNGNKEILKFDRILADVPCSGDGTLRKNPDIWCKWSPANGNNLHGVQYRIAKRGVELLTIGGKMVYSTCSLNPVENEGVLHRLLSETGDSVEIIDCKDFVPGLVFSPGLTSWKLASKNLDYFQRWEDVPEGLKTQIRPNMFPPKQEDATKYNLHKCMRILPHHQDTGGFFVAVLQKIKTLPWETSMSDEFNNVQKIDQDTDQGMNKKTITHDEKKLIGSYKKHKHSQGYREDPFIFFKDSSEDVWPSIKEFYDISDDLDPRCLLVRCQEGKKKNIYLTSPAIRDVVTCNKDKVKIINTGVKTFVRSDNKNMSCAFRLAQEGLNNIVHYIGDRRKIKIEKDDLILLLQNNNQNNAPEIMKLSQKTQDQVNLLAGGSCVLIYEEENEESLFPLKLNLVGWRGVMSLRAYVSIHDATHYLRLLGGDFSMLEKNKFQMNRDLTATEEGEK